MPMGKMTRYRAKKKKDKKTATIGYVNRKINEKAEVKYFDVDVVTTPINVLSGGVTYPLTDVQQGDSRTTRNGNYLTAFRMEIRGTIFMHDAVNAQVPQTVRVIVWRDNAESAQNSLIVPDVLETGARGDLQQYNADEIPTRFQVLHDKRYTVDPLHEPRTRNFYINIRRNMKMSFNGAGGSPPGKGRLSIGFISATADANPIAPKIQFCSRLFYNDI